MLSFFPELLFLSPLAALLIRVAAAIVFGRSAYKHLTMDQRVWVKLFGVVEAIIAVLLFVGFLTQPAALLGLIAIGVIFYLEMATKPILTQTTWWLMLVMCLSLLVLGAGPFAFDLPL